MSICCNKKSQVTVTFWGFNGQSLALCDSKFSLVLFKRLRRLCSESWPSRWTQPLAERGGHRGERAPGLPGYWSSKCHRVRFRSAAACSSLMVKLRRNVETWSSSGWLSRKLSWFCSRSDNGLPVPAPSAQQWGGGQQVCAAHICAGRDSSVISVSDDRTCRLLLHCVERARWSASTHATDKHRDKVCCDVFI